MLSIKGTDNMGLIMLVDDSEERAITITCDRNMIYQFSLRSTPRRNTSTLLPEVMWQMMSDNRHDDCEILITGVSDGQYNAVLIVRSTGLTYDMRASDAMLLDYASCWNIPITIEDTLFNRQSVKYDPVNNGMALPVNTVDVDILKEAWKKAVKDENYELASQLRDEINSRSSEK